jgi:hypothetical protein
LASALKISAMQLKVMPTPNRIGQASSSLGLWLMPSASITPRMAVTVNSALKAAHSISASTMSSSRTGAFRMPSQVFCTCMRENAEYSASKDAACMALMQMLPLARNRM